ncbi:carbohydrate ABC transporter permease [Streptomyces rapamycinicus]|uniref:ABC transporter permease n=2 Tax=Streptomyces rapamycinicus TaxID=1226757 RepID=A0A0A0NJD7_STRRN|nr:sugar ABC transporter permease [Streptomyces rapamycinicus]AGP54485.1 ABC transporter permease [Streptomyces rapamycinicus NRRL 5491]MBB4781992.1 multiple sugar transport system permease protein/raffinose/stachyose/melibiose transport system permease protein [Streptomyces rapamycinicus]RLV73366.1 ABC transporter permease [Streptomyces rapamycinicus NRRL 5491]UTO62539.1 sugar ABC transporter permease [Streptomyces rapamycinicus]UTP30494.1 sugar ABC transporter permease [Streptomyces rapamyci
MAVLTASERTSPAPSPPRGRWARGARRTPPLVLAFLLVPLLAESLWVFWPAFQGFYLALNKWDGVSAPEFVGLGNFAEMAHDEVFRTAAVDTVLWLVVFGGLSALLGLGAALLLQQERRGVGFYRAALFLPVVFSLVATALVWQAIYQPDGVLNRLLESVGLDSLRHAWLADQDTALYAVIVPALWRQVGYVMVLYLAGLKGIDPALYEAAKVDGAGRWQRFRHVTLPQLRSVNAVVLSVIIIDSLRSFDVVWSLTRGGPYHSSELLSTYMYSTAFQSLRLGYGSALAVVIFVLAFGVIASYLVRAFREAD